MSSIHQVYKLVVKVSYRIAKSFINVLLSTRAAAVWNSNLYMSASSLIVADRRKGFTLETKLQPSETVRYDLSSSVVIPVLILDDTIPKEPRKVPVPFMEIQPQEFLPIITYDTRSMQSKSQQCPQNLSKYIRAHLESIVHGRCVVFMGGSIENNPPSGPPCFSLFRAC
jgi:hypothetical protein